ncbi:MAG TPA: potassium transporter Kup [Rhodoplanes sp.]|nr:potassium transporter Kup [Rhodoplanes sp.]
MSSAHPSKNSKGLVVGAIGVVFGDIGTSPLYAIKETFGGQHAMPVEPERVLGVVSLVFWTIMALVTVKYVAIIMRADNRGEGGSLALLALVTDLTKNSKATYFVTMLGIFAAALFYGDSMITPAISVLSAVEGLDIVAPQFKAYVLPITIAVLCVLFWIQRRGTEIIGALFGPVMCLWFATLAVLGIVNILHEPAVMAALNPFYGAELIIQHPWQSFLALGAIFLAVTGGEALYADMGHFGRFPIRIAWFCLVLPALVLNYCGQAALLIHDPSSVANPFYLLAPEWALVPMVLLSTAATVIASQAVISGAFSVARQAVQLGYLPRMTITHTSSSEAGQIYVPFTNLTLFIGVIGSVLVFQSSSHLAAAYGIAVSGTMIISTILIGFVAVQVWRWSPWVAFPLLGVLVSIDALFFASNIIKIGQGGWFALAIAVASFTTLTTWKRGRELVRKQLVAKSVPLVSVINSLGPHIARARGTAVFMTATTEGVPAALLHNLKHNQTVHERTVLTTVMTVETPYVPDGERITLTDLGSGFYRLVIRYGFMETPDVPEALAACKAYGLKFDLMKTSFFLSRETIVPSLYPGMARWRELLFAYMALNATTAMKFFKIPTERVVELGTQLEI